VDANFLRAIGSTWEMISPVDTFKDRRKLLDMDPKERTIALQKAQKQTASCPCGIQHEGLQRAAKASLAISLLEGPEAEERQKEFAEQFLYHVVQHEFGHILGLRHNFVASTQLSPAQLSDGAIVRDKNIVASVMDYVDWNTYAIGRKGVPFFGRAPGDYDHWAVRYGYIDSGIRNPDLEQAFVKAIANQGGKWGLAYQSDEQADGLDPYTSRFDLSSDPIAHEEKRMQMAHTMLMTLDQRLPKAGESYFEFTRAFNMLINQYAGSAASTSKFIGGVSRSFSFKGDASGRKPFEPVPGKEQRRSLRLLTQYLLTEKAFDFPKSYYRLFAPDPKGGSMATLLGAYNDYPMFDEISGLQSQVLGSLLNPGTLGRLQNTEWKALPGDDVLSVSEVMTTVRGAIWSEVAKRTAVGPLRRQLQRTFVDQLISVGVRRDSSRGDINLLAWKHLRSLGAELAAAKSGDEMTDLHYAELSTRIARALNAIETLSAGGGGGGGFDLSALLGGRKPN
jgi:hypothetical protein